MNIIKPKDYKQSPKAEGLLRDAAEKIERTKSGISESAGMDIAKANRQKLKDGLIKGGLLKGS